jgi:hypothetical protein
LKQGNDDEADTEEVEEQEVEEEEEEEEEEEAGEEEEEGDQDAWEKQQSHESPVESEDPESDVDIDGEDDEHPQKKKNKRRTKEEKEQKKKAPKGSTLPTTKIKTPPATAIRVRHHGNKRPRSPASTVPQIANKRTNQPKQVVQAKSYADKHKARGDLKGVHRPTPIKGVKRGLDHAQEATERKILKTTGSKSVIQAVKSKSKSKAELKSKAQPTAPQEERSSSFFPDMEPPYPGTDALYESGSDDDGAAEEAAEKEAPIAWIPPKHPDQYTEAEALIGVSDRLWTVASGMVVLDASPKKPL